MLEVDYARLGPQGGIDTGTRGTIYFDSFVSRHTAYQGLGNELPESEAAQLKAVGCKL